MQRRERSPSLRTSIGWLLLVLLPLVIPHQADAFFPFPDWDSDSDEESGDAGPAPGAGDCVDPQVYCHGQGECSSDGSGCVCDKGWTGPFCERPLEDLAVTLVGPGVEAASTMNGSLIGGAYHCYTYTIDSEHNWNYFVIELNKTSSFGDPDLYIKPGSYPTQTDFIARDYSNQKTTIITLSKSDLGEEDFLKKWYVCVYAFGNQKTEYSLRASVSHCPIVFQASGPKQCSGHGQCNIFHGKCSCHKPFSVLGFPDCSASVLNLTTVPATNLSESTVQYVNTTIDPGHWQFFEVEVQDSEIELMASMSRLSPVGDPDLYLRYGSPPTLQNYDKKDLTYDDDHEIRVSQLMDGDLFQPGIWIVGVYDYGPKETDYELRVQINKCPSGCSGHGTCDANTHECHCKGGKFLADPPDCSAQLLPLTGTTSVLVEPSEIQMLEVNVTAQQKQAHAELRISSSITSETSADSLTFPFVLFGSEHPKLYVKFGSYPNGSSYDFMQPFIQHVAEIHVPASMVSPGTWWVEIDNPTTESLQVSTTVSFEGICDDTACNGHGICDPTTGLCACDPGYIGEYECMPESPLPDCIDGSTKIVQSAAVPERMDVYNCTGGHFPKLPSGHYCQQGYTLHGSECQAIAHSGCSKGAMLKVDTVPNGVCMSACSCDEDDGTCKFAALGDCIVHCNAGYYATEDSSAAHGMTCLYSGNSSTVAGQPPAPPRASPGTSSKGGSVSPGMAALLALSMLAAGGILCYGALWYVRNRGDLSLCAVSNSGSSTGGGAIGRRNGGDYLLHDLPFRPNNDI